MGRSNQLRQTTHPKLCKHLLVRCALRVSGFVLEAGAVCEAFRRFVAALEPSSTVHVSHGNQDVLFRRAGCLLGYCGQLEKSVMKLMHSGICLQARKRHLYQQYTIEEGPESSVYVCWQIRQSHAKQGSMRSSRMAFTRRLRQVAARR